ncbi:MAG: hypothetical protein V8R55_06865 [Dysosmobacter sp.]
MVSSPAVPLHCKLHQGLDLIGIGHIALEEHAFSLAHGVELRRRGLSFFLPAGGDYHTHARLAEHLGAAKPDAGVAAGDNGHLSPFLLQWESWQFPPVLRWFFVTGF